MTDPNIDSKIDKIIFRCFEQGHYWGELTQVDGQGEEKPTPPEKPIDRTQAVKAIQALVLQAEKAARIDELKKLKDVHKGVLEIHYRLKELTALEGKI